MRELSNPSDFHSLPTIDLQDWLKLEGWVGTGGEAKAVIQGGEVQVNGELETRRRRKLRPNDRVAFAGQEAMVVFEGDF